MVKAGAAPGVFAAGADIDRSASSWRQCCSWAARPLWLIATVVRGLLPWKALLTSTSHPASSLDRWAERFPWVRPRVRCRNGKSASATPSSTLSSAIRTGSCTRRSIGGIPSPCALIDSARRRRRPLGSSPLPGAGGALSKQLTALEGASHLETRKERGSGRGISVRLTKGGRAAFENYLTTLEALVARSRGTTADLLQSAPTT